MDNKIEIGVVLLPYRPTPVIVALVEECRIAKKKGLYRCGYQIDFDSKPINPGIIISFLEKLKSI